MPEGDEAYPYKEFGTIDELCSLIDADTGGWDTRWYRGLRTPVHTLLPKLFRDDVTKNRESYIAVEFRRRARAQLNLNGVSSPFEWLCAMQHYGLPTRLLDWTESLAIALYFASRSAKMFSSRPTVWVLDPFALDGLAEGGYPVIPIASSDSIRANADIAFGDNWEQSKKLVTQIPLPVGPDFLFNRLSAQNGTFTLHGTDNRPIEQLIPSEKRSMLLKYVARMEDLPRILKTLDLIVPSPDAVFPDLEGIRDYII